ncbi:DUF4157 domain-containing protein [Leptolyngbyaceae cyanobacterium UHCC 1019]
MQTHETPSFQPAASAPQNTLPAPRPFEDTHSGQELDSLSTNPFPPRPHDVWMGEPRGGSTNPFPRRRHEVDMGEPAIARKPISPEASPEPEATSSSIFGKQPFRINAPGTPPPPPPWWGIQPKLAIGQPNDVYEQEADRVAEQVMSMSSAPPPTVQRQAEEEEESEIQTKPLAETITPLVQRQELLEDDEPIQTKCETCEQEEPIQRAADRTTQAQPDLEDRLNSNKSSGSPLSDDVRSFMEPRFGADFSQVRVHTGSEAVQMNQELGAQAFTHQHDIYFGSGKSPGNDPLTAHELTHVVQQNSQAQKSPARPFVSSQSKNYSDSQQTENLPLDVQQVSPRLQLQHLSRQPRQARTTTDQLRLRQDLHILLDMYQNRILGRLDDWLQAAQNVGSAYAIAADRHQQAVAERARSEALQEAILFGVLTACCAGGLGWLAGVTIGGIGGRTLQQISRMSETAFENAQDTLVVFVSEGIDVYQAATQPQPQLISQNPLVFQNQTTNKIIQERQRVHQQFERWLEVLLNAPMTSYSDRASLDRFRNRIEAWTQESLRLRGGSNLPDIETMARRLECGFWARWIQQNLITRERERVGYDEFGVEEHIPAHDEFHSPGSAVEARLNLLGITRDSGVSDFGWWTSDAEIRQLVTWAGGYQPQPFIS